MIPTKFINRVFTEYLRSSDAGDRAIELLKKKLIELSDVSGYVVDWSKMQVCVPNLPNSCEDLFVWLKASVAQSLWRWYEDYIRDEGFTQANPTSCWAATAMMLKSILLQNPNRQNDTTFFEQNLKRIKVTQAMIDAAKKQRGAFQNADSLPKIIKILEENGPGRELSFDDSLLVYKGILWQDDLTCVNASQPEMIEWAKLKLSQFMYNSDPDKSGIQYPSNPTAEDSRIRNREFHIAFYAVLFRYGICTRLDPSNYGWPPPPVAVTQRVKKQGLLWPLATDWFGKILGFQVEKVRNRDLTNEKLIDILTQHGPFIIDTIPTISEGTADGNDPSMTHYIIVYGVQDIGNGQYIYFYANTAIEDAVYDKPTALLTTMKSDVFLSMFRRAGDPRIIVYES